MKYLYLILQNIYFFNMIFFSIALLKYNWQINVFEKIFWNSEEKKKEKSPNNNKLFLTQWNTYPYFLQNIWRFKAF